MHYLTKFFSACSRFVLAGLFWIAVRLFYDVEFHGLEHVNGKRPSYFAMAHKRDLDPIVEVPNVLARQGWRALAGDIYFAMRSDAFAPGFLSRMVMHPRWFSWFSRMLSLGSVLRFLGICPLENLHQRPAETWIRDLIHSEGDLLAGDVLSSGFLQQLSESAGEDIAALRGYRLSRLLAWRYHAALQHSYSVDILQQQKHWRTKNDILSQLKQQLAELTNWLARGGSIWGAPEGQLSPAGKIGPITAIVQRLLRPASVPISIVPIAIVYDFMTVKRARIFVDIAPSVPYNPQQQARELNDILRRAWLLNARFTCTQLASGFLVQLSKAAAPIFTLSELTAEIEQAAQRLHDDGRHVDARLLSNESARKLAASFVIYAERRQLVHRIAFGAYEVAECDLTMDVRPGSTGYQDYPLAYAWNELQDMLSVETHTGYGKVEAKAA